MSTRRFRKAQTGIDREKFDVPAAFGSVREGLGTCSGRLKAVTGDLDGRRLSSARRNAPAARPRYHCGILFAQAKGFGTMPHALIPPAPTRRSKCTRRTRSTATAPRRSCGVSAAAIWLMRQKLDEAGFGGVKIVASSGFGPAKCRMMAAANAPIDVIGTGSYLPELWSETCATAHRL
jgi:hypothetical protein